MNGLMSVNLMENGKITKCIFLINFIDIIRDGTGVFTWSDGRKYVGDYLDDKKHG